MQPVNFESAETYEPEDGWRRVSLAGSDSFSFEWFEKPPGHASPMHSHDNEQVCIVCDGELTVKTEAGEEITLEEYDSVYLEPNEPHRIINTGETSAIGIDVFAPGRSFDFWLDKLDEEDDE